MKNVWKIVKKNCYKRENILPKWVQGKLKKNIILDTTMTVILKKVLIANRYPYHQ